MRFKKQLVAGFKPVTHQLRRKYTLPPFHLFCDIRVLPKVTSNDVSYFLLLYVACLVPDQMILVQYVSNVRQKPSNPIMSNEAAVGASQ